MWKIFSSKENLNCHLLSHENKRQLKCPYEGCDKTFNHKENLNEHKAIHSKNKFKCNYCSHQTNHRTSLDDHI